MSYFTEHEEKAMALTKELEVVLLDVIGDGPLADADWDELAAHLHDIQRALMAQFAARVFPERFRVLGEVLGGDES